MDEGIAKRIRRALAGIPEKKRRVRVRFTIDMEIEVPEDWDAGLIEFWLNESSWCADNLLDLLEKYIERLNGKEECLCAHSSAEYLGEVEGG